MAYYIEEYQGVYRAVKADQTNTSHRDKSEYYPDDDVVIEFRVVEHLSGRVKNPVPAKVLKGEVVKGTWSGKAGLEDAVFYFHGGIVVSDPIQTTVPSMNGGPDLTVTEAIMLLNDGTMEHQLMWSDGDFGRWGCSPVKA